MAQAINLEFGIDISQALSSLNDLAKQGEDSLKKIQSAFKKGIAVPAIPGGEESGKKAGEETAAGFSKTLSDKLTSFSKSYQAAFSSFKDGKNYLDDLRDAAEKADTVFGGLSGVIDIVTTAENALATVTGIMETVQGALNAVMEANPIGIVVAAIALLISGIVYAYQHSETFRNILDSLWESIKSGISFFINWMTPIGQIVNWFKLLYEKVGFVKDAIDGLGKAVSSVGDFFSGLFGSTKKSSDGLAEHKDNVVQDTKAINDNTEATKKGAEEQDKANNKLKERKPQHHKPHTTGSDPQKNAGAISQGQTGINVITQTAQDGLKKQEEDQKNADAAKLAEQKQTDEKAVDQMKKNQEEAESIRLDLMQEGIDKEITKENDRYQKQLSDAKKNGQDTELVEALHQKNLNDIAEKAVQDRNLIYKAAMAGMQSVTSQGLDWLDSRWKLSVGNQKTALFQALSQMTGALKSALQEMIQKQMEHLVSHLLISGEIQESNAATGSSYLGVAASAVASAAQTVGSWVAAAAGTIANGAVIVGENIIVAASFAANAIAAAFAAFASIPFIGYLLGIAAAGVVAADWNGIKRTLGFAQGGIAGFGLVGEEGPEVVAPMKDFSSMVTDLVMMTQKTLLSSMNASHLTENSGPAPALKSLVSEVKELRKQQASSMLNVHVTGSSESKTELKGSTIETATKRSFNHIAAITA